MKSSAVGRVVWFFVFCILFSIHGVFAESRLFLLRGEFLHILNAVDGREIGQRNARNSNFLLGTPGGKYVFVLNSSTGRGYAVDYENPDQMKEVDLSLNYPFSGLVFSPMGDVLYAVGSTSNRITSFSHKAGEISDPVSFNLSGVSVDERYDEVVPAVSSRGTRLYRGGMGNLEFFLTSDGSLLKNVPKTSGILFWSLAPGGRYLWGTDSRGWTIVDESKARIVKSISIKKAEIPRFSADGRSAWALAQDGRNLVKLDVRRHRVSNQYSLPERGRGAVPDGSGGVWLATAENLYRLESNSDRVALSGKLPGEGSVVAFEAVELKSGQGFACF